MSYSGADAKFAYLIDLEVIIANYAHIAVAALFVYDVLLTVSREVDQIWGRRFSGTTALYLINRYGFLLQKVLIVLQLFPWESITAKSCAIISWINAILILITFLVISAFFALRVYAILNRSLIPAIVVFALGCVLPTVTLYQQITFKYFVAHAPVLDFVICDSSTSILVSTYSILATTCRATTAASDFLVLVITLMKTYKLKKMAKEHNVHTPLTTLLLRDGSLYFAAIFTFNLLDIILLQFIAFGAVADIVTTLSVILISRFMLNLRDLYLPEVEFSLGSHAQFSSVRFTDVLVGTLGAPLDHEEPDAAPREEETHAQLPEFIQGSSKTPA